MNDKYRWRLFASWALFLFLLVLVCILSFQSGSATKALERPLVGQMTGRAGTMFSEEKILTITFYIRQIGRAAIFFALGASWAFASYLTFAACTRRTLCLIGCAVLLVISYVTEKGKIFIEGRHYSFAQFVESFLFGMAGVLLFYFSLRLRKKEQKNT